ncbi:phage tail assembly chaperone [Vibrio aerogenes]|uniref:phage tail assembly chaperone n=1 Tax=Vibrio aerogenes TaxID=92172 RepID=UPI003F9AC0FF
MPPGSRVTQRQTLIQVWKTTGKKPERLAEHPELPDALTYLWEWFQELHSGEALSFSEIHSWARMTHRNLRGWEVDVLRSLDRIHRSTYS